MTGPTEEKEKGGEGGGPRENRGRRRPRCSWRRRGNMAGKGARHPGRGETEDPGGRLDPAGARQAAGGPSRGSERSPIAKRRRL